MIPSPASTVVVVRQGQGDIEVLLLLRNSALRFNGGHWVFPGGRIDRVDYPDLACVQEYQAALRAAVRETQEEAGLDISDQTLRHIAHWTTPEGMSRRFSTWFFMCMLREEVAVQVDGVEILEHRWLSPSAALDAFTNAGLKLPEPTLHTLRSIRAFHSLDTLSEGLAKSAIHVFPENSPFYRVETIEQ